MRRISETLTTPLQSSGGGPVGGGGGGGGGGSGQTQTFTDREYVWAPPPSGYVDECVCQIDRNNAVRYVIQDASYDVVAIVSPQTSGGNPQPSKVIAQYTWDPYGQVLTAEYSGLASTYNKLGHHGLFADRLDANYQSATLAAGFVASTHLPARIIYQVRNRIYDPSTQRWLQRDPNATGQVVLGSLSSGGQAMSGAVSGIELTTLYGDGMSLYGYVGNGPVLGNDPTGLFEGGAVGMSASSGLQAMLGHMLLQGAIGGVINGSLSGLLQGSWSAAGRGAVIGFTAGFLGGGAGYTFQSAYGHAAGAFASGATFGGTAGWMESGGDWRVAAANAAAGAALGWAVEGLVPNFFSSAFASQGEIGVWRAVRERMSARAAAYQGQITGRPGEAYVVGGVKFDGYGSMGLLEAKGPGYAGFIKDGSFRSWFKGADSLVSQAQRQVTAAQGTPIIWHVAEAKAASAMQHLLRVNNIRGIRVVHTPAVP